MPAATAPPAQTSPPATPPAPDKPTSPSGPIGNEPPQSDWLGGIESDMSELDAGSATPTPGRDDKGKFVSPDKAKPKDSPKPADKPKEPDELTTDDKPVDTGEDKPPVTAPDKPGEVKPVKTAALREAYEGLKKRVKEELEPEVQKLRAKVTEYESKGGEQLAPMMEKMKQLEARNTQLENDIEYLDFQHSKKFNDEHAEPYARAWEDAVNTFRQLTVRQQQGEDDLGDPKYVTRAADENDLLRLANMKLSDIDAAAQEMFGASAARAILHVEKIKDLSAKQHRALAEARNKSGERMSQRTAEFQQNAKVIADTWDSTNKVLAEKFPRAFKVEEGNAEDAESFTKGFALADLMFLGERALKPEQIAALPSNFRATLESGKPLSNIQKTQLHALARLKMANHDRRVAALKKANSRIAELEKQLGEYEDSAPPAGKAGKGERPGTSKDWEQQIADEINALDK